nr:alpha/beta fold hydrolase [Rhodococcus sp. HNM0569]
MSSTHTLTWPDAAVVLPGTGSDATFAHAAFASALRARGVRTVVAVEPDPDAVVASYERALEDAAERGPVVVGGISLGAVVALDWAARRAERGFETFGVLAALPPWTGDPVRAPAAVSARMTAESLRAQGLDAVLTHMQATSPDWLAAALTRSWHSQWPGLPNALDEAGRRHAPDAEALVRTGVAVGIAAATDDPVHPHAVAAEWNRHLPRSRMCELTLDEIGARPALLGERAADALERALQA